MKFEQRQKNSDEIKVNRAINYPQVRVFAESGDQLGILRIQDAMIKARDLNLDLILITENATPPVCRIADAGKFKFEKQKAQKEQAKKLRESKVEVKTLKFRPGTGDADITRLMSQAQEFLEDGDKVYLELKYKGRENSHKDLGFITMREFIAKIENCVVERQPTLNGNTLSAMLAPKPVTKTN